jgi:hypothetical protein
VRRAAVCSRRSLRTSLSHKSSLPFTKQLVISTSPPPPAIHVLPLPLSSLATTFHLLMREFWSKEEKGQRRKGEKE